MRSTMRTPAWPAAFIVAAAVLSGASLSGGWAANPCPDPERSIAESPALQRLVTIHEIERSLAESAVDLRHLDAIISGADLRDATTRAAMEKAEKVSSMAERQRAEFIEACRLT